jgi:hypothetical protein
LKAGKTTMTLDFMFNVMPVFLLNAEFAEFEDGYWRDRWPGVKGFGRWILFKIVPLWQAKRWRFTSCDGEGRKKRLVI